MRLTLSALLCAALFASPALAGDRHDPMLPPGAADMPPPHAYDGPDRYGRHYDQGSDPRWQPGYPPMHGEWMERCRAHHGDHRGRGAHPEGCGYPAPYPYAPPGAYMGYAVPMVMVPVLRSKPCPEVVEEIVEEVAAPPRRRIIRPRPVAVPDKRVPMTDKRVKVVPAKRIAY